MTCIKLLTHQVILQVLLTLMSLMQLISEHIINELLLCLQYKKLILVVI